MFATSLLASALTITVSQATPLLTLGVKAVQTGLTGNSSPGVTISPDGLDVQMDAASGQVVLQLVASLHGLDADLTNDLFYWAGGTWITWGTTGGLTGSLRSNAPNPSNTPGIDNVSPFDGFAARSGPPGELSCAFAGGTNDGILDFGGVLNADGSLDVSTITNAFLAMTGNLLGAVGESFILGESILSLDDGTGSTAVRFAPRVGTNPLRKGNIKFRVDGVYYSMNGDGTIQGSPIDADALQFQSVTIEKGAPIGGDASVPEPSSLTMLLLGALGFCRRRRRA